MSGKPAANCDAKERPSMPDSPISLVKRVRFTFLVMCEIGGGELRHISHGPNSSSSLRMRAKVSAQCVLISSFVFLAIQAMASVISRGSVGRDASGKRLSAASAACAAGDAHSTMFCKIPLFW